ncbi:AIG2-like family protein [Stieleria maiorica]|uniref:AIG2-like family protein n=1 Tax=Stieleria maiorica TaxID=2795974 RepID=A0A5B9MII7_9BACT|nr:gamma-glutamylcyclotransferase family protein [Stieleria maiorica]QEF99770.1 AIG2-like family protein [Stieleria maiorica]
MKYFAYGSNCNPAIMEKKGVSFTTARRAVLPGYRMLFNKLALRESLPAGIGFANINEDAGGEVEGILYEIVDDHLDRLDQSERYPDHYGRIEVTVHCDDQAIQCISYQAQSDKIADGLRPSRNYLNHILEAKDFLSWQYFEALDKSQTFEDACACCGKLGEVVFIREEDQLHMLCQPCREARLIWGDTRGRRLTVAETKAMMTQVVQVGPGFGSIGELVQHAIDTKVIDP